jgi:hypothetical protein
MISTYRSIGITVIVAASLTAVLAQTRANRLASTSLSDSTPLQEVSSPLQSSTFRLCFPASAKWAAIT